MVRNNEKQSLYLGVDIGGTQTKIVIIDQLGSSLASKAFATEANNGVEFIVQNIIRVSELLLIELDICKNDISAMGIAVPGTVNPLDNSVRWAPNIFWNDVKLAGYLSSWAEFDIFLENDANSFAVSEHEYGSAKGFKNALVVAIGTGIGAGVIINNGLLVGSNLMAGEIGHMCLYPNGIRCNCGQKGCFEMYASIRAIARIAIQRGYEAFEDDKVVGDDSAGRVIKELIEDAIVGDKKALSIWKEYIDDLALGLSNAVRLIDPEVIVLGGGILNAGDFFIGELHDSMQRLCIEASRCMPILRQAHYTDNAGAIGAAVIARIRYLNKTK